MNTADVFSFDGWTVDISDLDVIAGLDASRWAGRVKIVVGGATVAACWKGAEGATDGALLDVEGEDEAACEAVDARAEELAEQISRRLADPCSPEERRALARAGWYDDAA